jgi:hypothetical protein
MNHQDIVNALNTLTPGAIWTLSGDGVENIVWLDTVQTQPTETAMIAAAAAYVPSPTLQQQIATLQAQIATLIAAKS